MNCPHCSTANPDYAESCSNCGSSMPVSDAVTISVVDTSALSVGSDFGTRYRIESILGQGGMGRVYKAYDKQLDRVVAIKVVRQGMMGSEEALKRFKQELLLASKVSHKNILRIHDMGEVGEVKFISMAFVEGQDLHQILHGATKLPFERALNFSRQLADALSAAHAEGVVHRDLKPQNILVGKGDQLFVSDFGLAKSFEDDSSSMTRTGAFLGTPRYMAPEQVEGNPADQRSDIYSYGLILYEMVTGDIPFSGETTLKLMYQRIQQIPKSPKVANPNLPDWYVGVVMKCLEREPATRYQSASEILADLQGQQVSVVIPKAATRTVQIQVPGFAQKRWVWGVAAALVLAILAFAIPQVRNLILGKHEGGAGSSISGIPSLEQGRYVAILPFRVLGDEKQLGYVADGLNEALSAKLFQLQGLHLASNAAVEKVSDKDPTDKIARSLGVNLIVTGMVQGSADNIRVVVNLDDVTSGKRTWSQEFSGVPKDLLTIEDQLSSQLIAALEVKPTSQELAETAARPTDNEDAYDLYLRGRQAYRTRDSIKGTQTAIDYYKKAIQKDPGFALAYTGLSDASLAIYDETKDTVLADKAIDAAQHAEQLKDNLPEAHFALGSAYAATGKNAQAISEFQRGLQLAPNSDQGYQRLGNVYLRTGQKDMAVAEFQKAIQVNPYYWVLHRDLANAYFSIGENEKALDEFKRVTELQPENAEGWSNVATTYGRLARYPESIAAYQKSIQLTPTWLAYCDLGIDYIYLKQYPEAIQALEKAVGLGPNQELAMGNLGDAYRYAGQHAKATATYEKAIALAFQDLRVNPQDTDVMGDLASYFAKKGDSSQAVEFIQRARKINKFDVELIHTQAVVEALTNKPTEAIQSLREALGKGYPLKQVQEDPDLAVLQNRPDFQALMKEFSRQNP